MSTAWLCHKVMHLIFGLCKCFLQWWEQRGIFFPTFWHSTTLISATIISKRGTVPHALITLFLVSACLVFSLQCIPHIHIILSLWCISFLLSVPFWPWNYLDINNFHPSIIRWWSDDIRVWDGNSNCSLEKNTTLGELCRSWCSFVWEQRILFTFSFCNFNVVEEERLIDLSRKRIIIPSKTEACMDVTV